MIEEIKIEKDKTPKTTPNKPILDVDHKNGKKKYYKPRKKREILDIKIDKIGLNNFHKIVHTEKPYLEYKKLITNKNVGSYFMGTGKGFRIHLEKKPNWLHRKCMELFLGWKWIENNEIKSHKL